jgi:uncharacterized membrane protein
MLLLDGVWHAGIMADFYAHHMRAILGGAQPSLSWTLITLIGINAVTLTYMVQSHIEQKRSTADVLWVGALLGFTVASSINLLNLNFFGWWDITLVLVDTAWGTVAGMIGAMVILSMEPIRKKGIFGSLKRKKKA